MDFFSCEKGKTEYKVHYAKKPKQKEIDLSRVPYCESVTRNLHISPAGRLAPCMGFTSIGDPDRFPSVLEQSLAELTLTGACQDIANTSVEDLVKVNPECKDCKYLYKCSGGCMVESASEDGNYMIPDQRCCYFHKNIGEDEVRSSI